MQQSGSVISFVSPKGGAGKTTSAMILAEQLLIAEAKVAVIDCDPNNHISHWKEQREKQGLELPFDIFKTATEDELLPLLDNLKHQYEYIVMDMEGAASQVHTFAVGRSDLVIIPLKPTPMEARMAGVALSLIKNTESLVRHDIPHALLFTRTAGPIMTQTARTILKDVFDHDVPYLSNQLVNRGAYEVIFDKHLMVSEIYAQTKRRLEGEGATPSAMERALEPIEKALKNAHSYAQEVANLLQEEEAAA